MPTITNLLVDGDGTGAREWANQDFATIDEAVGTANQDNDTISSTSGAVQTTTFTLQNMPSDFGTMDSLTITLRYWAGATGDDTDPLLAIIQAGDAGVLLAAGDVAGTYQEIVANVNTTTHTNVGPLGFAYVNTSATKTDWDAAQLYLRRGHSGSMSNDNRQVIVASLDLDGVYTAASASFSGTVAVTQANQTSTATGVLGYSGTVAVTQAADTASASGWITITGTVARTQADQTSTASGTSTVTASVEVLFQNSSDLDLFTAETVNSCDNTITKTLEANQGVFTGVSGTNGNDRRLYLYDSSFQAINYSVLTRFSLENGTPNPAQTGLVARVAPNTGSGGRAPLAWTNIIFGANANLLHGVWQYDATTLNSTNQNATSNFLYGIPVTSIVGDGTKITVTTSLPHLVKSSHTIVVVSSGLGLDVQVNGGITVVSDTVFEFANTTSGSSTGYYKWVFIPGKVWARASLRGDQLTTRYWADGHPEPLASDSLRTVTVTLPTNLAFGSQTLPTGVGRVGIVVAHMGAGGKIRIDRFQAINLDTPAVAVIQDDQRSTASGTFTPSGVSGTVTVTQASQTSTAAGYIDGGSYLLLDGTSGCYADTPDHSSLDITGDLDLRAEAHPFTNNWLALGSLMSKYDTTGNQRSYRLRVTAIAGLNYTASTNGTATVGGNSTVAIPTGSGKLGVRVTHDVDNGSSQNVVRFYTAPGIDGTWTQLGADIVNSGVVSIFAGTAVLEVGSVVNGTLDRWNGKIYAVEIRNGIDGTVVARPDFRTLPAGTTSFVDSTGKTWTLHGSAAVAFAPERTGTSTATQANQTSTASGTVSGGGIDGTAAVTQASQTSTASGVLGYSGTTAITQANQTSTATGILGYSGSVAVTQANQTATASGSFTGIGEISGSAAVTQANQTSTASGQLGYTGTVARTQANQTATAAGWITITGIVAETQDNQTGSATGQIGVNGTVARTQANQVATASGWITVTGLVAATQASQTSTATGFVGEIPTPTGRSIAVPVNKHRIIIPAASYRLVEV